MQDCEFCGSPRINGIPVEETENGWQPNTGPLNPVREDLKFACRDCAKEKINQ